MGKILRIAAVSGLILALYATITGVVAIRGQQSEKPATATLALVSSDESGQPLIVQGTVYGPDGTTPAADVSIEAHQTAQDGRYHRNLVTGRARIHGTLRTDSQGRFEIRTIRPGSYPGENIPEHIHFKAWGGGFPEQGLPDLLFANDPKLRPGMQGEQVREGRFANVCSPRNDSGVLHCTLNFKLRR